jgi:hypothetical protein
VSWVFVGFLGLEFLSYVLVPYMSLLFVHGPFAQKPFMRKYFEKAKMMDSTITLKQDHLQG